MACKPPMAPKSMPYWNGDIDTRVHAAMHFQLERRLLVKSGMAAGLRRFVAMVKKRKSNETMLVQGAEET